MSAESNTPSRGWEVTRGTLKVLGALALVYSMFAFGAFVGEMAGKDAPYFAPFIVLAIVIAFPFAISRTFFGGMRDIRGR